MKSIVLSLTILNNIPLAAGYVVASARKASHDAELWEEALEDYPDENSLLPLAKRIIDAEPTILAFSAYVWNLQRSLELAKIIKKNAPHITLVFGGPGVSFSARYLLSRYAQIDYIVRGEGEISFTKFLGAFPDVKNVPSLSYIANGIIIENPQLPAIENLDEVPSPYLTGILTPRKEILIETHRGCVFKCGYCQEARGYAGIRPFSAKRIADELTYAESKGAKRVSLVNSIYNITPQRVEELTPILARHDIRYSIDTYATLLNERIADLYQKAGIYGTDIGLQSINRPALIAMRRPYVSPEKFREKHQLLKERGVKTNVHLIIGLPGDTFETFREGFEYVSSLEPTNIGTFKLLVLPGTPFHTEAEKHGLRFNAEPPFDVFASNTFPAADVHKAVIYAEAKYKEFIVKNEYPPLVTRAI